MPFRLLFRPQSARSRHPHGLFTNSCDLVFPTSFLQLKLRVSSTRSSSTERRPKKKVYHRDYELDRVMELQKKPSLILRLKSIIRSQRHRKLALRDLEKEVGFAQKWNFMSIIERYPSTFCAFNGDRNGEDGGGSVPFITLAKKAASIAEEEAQARALMEPILVKNLKKLLMMSTDCKLPLAKLDLISSELGLPDDFRRALISKYPESFLVKTQDEQDYLCLENWDPLLAVTCREERLAQEGIPKSNPPRSRVKITKDGNFSGPFAFKMRFSPGFRPNRKFLDQLEKWQRMDFPSPYFNPMKLEGECPKTKKRILAVIHELMSLTMEKRLCSSKLEAFHPEFLLPCGTKLLLCLVRLHGVFYLTNKGSRSTVFLKDAYHGSNLIDRCPLILFNDRFLALSGHGLKSASSSCVSKNS